MNVFVFNRKPCFFYLSLSTKIVKKMSLSTEIIKILVNNDIFLPILVNKDKFLKTCFFNYMFHICHKSSMTTYGANWGWGNGEANI
jgi:hypothetical protein